jgi:RNA polymerase sigma factor (sigma-70 family)
MSAPLTFQELMDRVRAGDAEAAAELVRRYEPVLRRTVRVRMRDQRLRRIFDSIDVTQSVLGSFFVRAAKGQYDVDTPEQVEKLLARMARNKLADQVDRQRAACRDNRRVEDDGLEGREIIGGVPTPSREAAARDTLGKVRQLLTEEEMQLLELREAGHDWAEIAQLMNGSAEALRKKLARALERVAEQLGPQEADG